MVEQKPPRYRPYNRPAGGWGAAAATAKVLLEQSVVTKGSRALLAMNQPGGFKCPSCAFPDSDCTKKFEFCENGVKALAFEATTYRMRTQIVSPGLVKTLGNTMIAGRDFSWAELYEKRPVAMVAGRVSPQPR